MDFTQNKDDPHGVQRLLGILRRQQDSSSSPSAPAPSSAAPSSSSFAASNPFSTSSSSTAPTTTTYSHPESDAAVRRRTYNSSSKYTPTTATDPFDPYSFNPFSTSSPPLPAPIPTPPKPAAPRDLSSLSFAESLPILSTLSSDRTLLKRLSALRTEQHDLERRLTKDYRQFAATADKQYPQPRARRDEDERRRKDILRRWDACVKRQQEELRRAGVPGIRVTSEKRECDKQRRIVGVLAEMMDEGE
ncbi:hypothetical protein PSEUBRA_005469 [Kalmanozyma brasiliensis GHG001]|uniref:Uncharacterized protein n=1 Tax=Kalmanozyma brasiliensis (strain GHG001) TaxID=1365824 RepID=V5EK25_KALBG|nr:uncharacterized protein PSEUBRA_005469 [Kalmanozyma brasiliensis GHG001]EST05205.1 hypothetical protein PSEUBRA_005469 [Kalmanozyma brasiliensis GHG001]